MLDDDDHALGLGSLGHLCAHHGGENRVFGEILEVSAAVRCAVNVETRSVPAGITGIEGVFAQALAHLLCQIGIEGRGNYHFTGIVYAGNAVLSVGDVQTAGAVLHQVLRQANALNGIAAQVGDQAGHVSHRQLIQNQVPFFGVVVRAHHHSKLVVCSRACSNGGSIAVPGLIGLGNGVDHVLCGRKAGVLHRPGGVPVGAAQISHSARNQVIDIRIVKEVGDAYVGGFRQSIGLGISTALLPLGGVGRVARGGLALLISHAGGSLCRQNVIQRIMGTVADGHVIVAGFQNVRFLVLIIIGSELLFVYSDLYRLSSVGGQFAGLTETDKVHRGLFQAVLPVVVGIGTLTVELDYAFARHAASVFHGDGNGHSLAVIGEAIQRLLKGGVTQTVAEGVNDLIRIVPRAASAAALSRRSVATAEDGVFIPSLVIFITHIQALGFHQIAGYGAGEGHHSPEVVRREILRRHNDVHDILAVGVLIAGVVHRRWGRLGVGGIGSDESAAGVHIAHQDVRHRFQAVLTGGADPEYRIHIILADPAHVWGVGAVDEYDDLVKIALGRLQQLDLVGLELQIVGSVAAPHG